MAKMDNKNIKWQNKIWVKMDYRFLRKTVA